MELINNNQVPEGYKKIEVGVIPDWKVLRIKDIAPLQRGFDLPTSQVKKGNYPVVYSNGVMNYHSEFMVNGPGVITGRSGTIGNVHYVSENYWPHNTALWVTDFIDSHPKYIYYLYKFLKLERFGTGSGVPTLNRNDVHDLIVAIPKLEEQKAIAQTLSDVDVLIAALDKLIAKKRHIKTGTMQQLLTGKTRLPGFGGEWEQINLGNIAEIISGGTPKTTNLSYWNGNIKWCTPTDITGCKDKYLLETERTISYLGLKNSGAQLLPAGTLLLCSRATIGEVKIASCEICTNQGFKSIICSARIDNEFLYYKLLTMKQQMIERAFGSTFLEISKLNVAALELSIPLPPEQKAIAQVLSDIDTEITALEKRRAKTQAIKQGMMQELLTGRTRLKFEHPDDPITKNSNG